MTVAVLTTALALGGADLDSWLGGRLAEPKFAAAWRKCTDADWRDAAARTALLTSAPAGGDAKLAVGRELARRNLADEAAAVLDELDPTATVDPAALLFFRGGARQSLGRNDAAVRDFLALEKLPSAPQRYLEVARHLRERLAKLDPQTLTGVAHDMREIRRRLDVGKPDRRTQELQADVLKRLDKMIDDLDKQCKACQAGAKSKAAPAKPADKSKPLSADGKGEVADGRQFKDYGKWSDLPPKEREKALQDLSRDLPANYRDAVEEYFKRVASEAGSDRP